MGFKFQAKRSGNPYMKPHVWFKAKVIKFWETDQVSKYNQLGDGRVSDNSFAMLYRVRISNDEIVDYTEYFSPKFTNRTKMGIRVEDLSGVNIDWGNQEARYDVEKMVVGKLCMIMFKDDPDKEHSSKIDGVKPLEDVQFST